MDAQFYLCILTVAHVPTGGHRRNRNVHTTVDAVAYLYRQNATRGLALCPNHLLAVLHVPWIAHLPADYVSSTCSEKQVLCPACVGRLMGAVRAAQSCDLYSQFIGTHRSDLPDKVPPIPYLRVCIFLDHCIRRR